MEERDNSNLRHGRVMLLRYCIPSNCKYMNFKQITSNTFQVKLRTSVMDRQTSWRLHDPPLRSIKI